MSLSRHEAFGIVIAEAGAAGLPIVASDIPAHREVAGYLPDGQVRFVSPDCSPAELAAAVRGAVDDAAGRSAREPGGAALPTWDGAADRIVALYHAVLGAPRKAIDRDQPGDGRGGR